MENNFFTGIALSPRKTNFGPVMFSGRLDEGLEAVHQAGFSFVELSIRTKDDLEPKVFNQRCKALGLGVTAVATGQACLFDNLCLGSDDPIRQQNAVDHFKEIADFAKEINSGAVIIGGIRGSLNKDGDYAGQYARGVDAFRSCAEWTDSIGIPLLIEPINRYETNWIYTAEEGRKVLDMIGLDSVKLLLDTFHMNIEEANMVEAILKTGDQLGYVHFADNTRHAPGQGQTDFKAVLAALEKINYHGPIVAECLPLPDDLTAVRNTAKFWQQISP
jgi:sugar phosphate isomerase/epimerase